MRLTACILVLATSCREAPAPATNDAAPLEDAAPAVGAGQPSSSASALLDAAPAATGCPPGMLLIAGKYCPYVGHRCVDWIDEKRDRCRRYSAPPICEGRIVDLSFCMDRYEYPNQKGVLPAVMVSYIEAQAVCHEEDKRLCSEDEWTFACEGEERLPYPYGYERSAEACNIDRAHVLPDFDAFSRPTLISAEVERLDKRVRSGSMPGCKSPFGVFDMTGNVDEWTVNPLPNREAGVDVSSLKGGYFGPIRARCRPVTRSHNRWFRFYQVGFRCCRDRAQPQ